MNDLSCYFPASIFQKHLEVGILQLGAHLLNIVQFHSNIQTIANGCFFYFTASSLQVLNFDIFNFFLGGPYPSVFLCGSIVVLISFYRKSHRKFYQPHEQFYSTFYPR